MSSSLHKVQGLGASHTGTGHFWHERLTSAALIPLTLWFGYSMLGLAGATEVGCITYLAHWWNALLMAAFMVITLWHIKLGLQVVIDDYVHSPGKRIALLLLVRFLVLATGSAALFALLQISRL
jgi:succinate dehydrogenase / fumarate reductase membrane anchor subunit